MRDFSFSLYILLYYLRRIETHFIISKSLKQTNQLVNKQENSFLTSRWKVKRVCPAMPLACFWDAWPLCRFGRMGQWWVGSLGFLPFPKQGRSGCQASGHLWPMRSRIIDDYWWTLSRTSSLLRFLREHDIQMIFLSFEHEDEASFFYF